MRQRPTHYLLPPTSWLSTLECRRNCKLRLTTTLKRILWVYFLLHYTIYLHLNTPFWFFSWIGGVLVWGHSGHSIPGHGVARVYEAIHTSTKVSTLYIPLAPWVLCTNLKSQIRHQSHFHLHVIISTLFQCTYPFPYRTMRYCTSTIQIGDVTIPKGSQVIVPINVLHHSPEYWPDPYKFDPERYV